MKKITILFLLSVLISGLSGFAQSLSLNQTISGNADRGISAGDINNDGNIDFLLLRPESGVLECYLNNGTGTFSLSSQINKTSWEPSALIDMNADSNLDIVIITDKSEILLGDGTGINFNSYAIYDNHGSGDWFSAAFGDIDCINGNDFLVSSGDTLTIHINDNQANFAQSYYIFPNIAFVSLADIDNDGDLDLLRYTNSEYVRVYINDGTGNFVDSEQTLVLRQFNFKTSQVSKTCEVWIKKLFSMFHF